MSSAEIENDHSRDDETGGDRGNQEHVRHGTGNHAGSGEACSAPPLPTVPIYEYMMTPRTFSAFRIAS